MRVGLCTPSIMQVGGGDSYMRHLSRQLADAGAIVSTYRLASTSDGRVFVVPYTVTPGTQLDPESDIFPWADLWSQHDVVHVTAGGGMYTGFEQALDKKVGPLVVTVHDPFELQVGGKKFLRLLHLADGIIFISPTYMAAFREHGYLPQEEFDAKATHIRQPYVPPAIPPGAWAKTHPPRIVCTSAWRWNKGIGHIIQAAQWLGEYYGLRVELWSADRQSDVEAMVQEYKGYEYVDVIDGFERLPEVYGAAEVSITMTYFDEDDTGRTEYPILESWAYGVTPVVRTTFVGENPVQIIPDVNVVRSGTTPQETAAAIAGAAQRPLLRSAMERALLPHSGLGPRFIEVYGRRIA